jgi:hypothetical protein
MGHRVHQNVGPPLCLFVPRFGCSGRIVGHVSDMVAVSHDVYNMSHEESDDV